MSPPDAAPNPGQPPGRYERLHVDARTGARRGRWSCRRGVVELPAFMPVGTQGTVKGLTVQQVRDTGARMILGNTYHLALRPGIEVIERLGGLHAFTGWDGPILTDSGGFQVFSLADRSQVTEHGVVFASHIDGTRLELTPESAMDLQRRFGSDIAMVLDHVTALPAERSVVADACERSTRWAARCRDAADGGQAVFGIVQGGLDLELRRRSVAGLREMAFDGYAIGGLSVGEDVEEMVRILDDVVPLLPEDRPRYLMGVGRPEDLLAAVARGVDLFDCVMPTRNGRNALAFTDRGPVRLRNLVHRLDDRPLEDGCPCPACRLHSRGYLRHLFQAREMLGPTLVSAHNLTYYQGLMARARVAIEADAFAEFREERRREWAAGAAP